MHCKLVIQGIYVNSKAINYYDLHWFCLDQQDKLHKSRKMGQFNVWNVKKDKDSSSIIDYSQWRKTLRSVSRYVVLKTGWTSAITLEIDQVEEKTIIYFFILLFNTEILNLRQ